MGHESPEYTFAVYVALAILAPGLAVVAWEFLSWLSGRIKSRERG